MGSTRTPREAAAQDSHVEPFEGNMLMSAPNAIKPQNLYRLIGTPDAPCLIDVTSDIDFNEDPFLLPTAERCVFSITSNSGLSLFARLSGGVKS